MSGMAGTFKGDFPDVKNANRVVINVGGSRHECYISTIQNFPDTRLYWIAETALKMADFDPDANEFFFDRHPGCFENIMNYCRTGKLHCPKDVCGPLFEEELTFWGVNELMMEACCWASYTEHRQVTKNLEIFHDTDNNLDESNTRSSEDAKETAKVLMKLIWNLLERPQKTSLAKLYTMAHITTILLSICIFCLQTEPHFADFNSSFKATEMFCSLFFSFDLLLRFISCPSLAKLLKDSLTWVDLITLVPFYTGFFVHIDALSFLLTLRLIRIFHLLRFFKSLRGMLVIGETLKSSVEQLLLLVLVLLVPMVIFATMIYYAEKRSKNSKFSSIPRSFWWAIITLSTVGYGDMTPSSPVGKMVGAMCASCGILVVALPISVIGNNFSFYYAYAKARMKLPKRNYDAMVNADKNLLSKTQEGEETPSRSRRFAITPTKDHCSPAHSYQDEPFSSTLLHPYIKQKPIYKQPTKDRNDEKPSVFNLNSTRAFFSLKRKKSEWHGKCKRRQTITEGYNEVLTTAEIPFPLSQSLDLSANKTKRVLHLDIQQYMPLQFSSVDRDLARRRVSVGQRFIKELKNGECDHPEIKLFRENTIEKNNVCLNV